MDIEYQRKLEAQIQQQNIHQQYEHAVENHPEFFGRVIMLYIDCLVNGVHVKAFVDSGAQVSICAS
jgi:DNA damage-inducible protein 1